MELSFKPRIIDPDAKRTHCERTPHIQTQFRITNLKCGRNNNNNTISRYNEFYNRTLISNFVNFLLTVFMPLRKEQSKCLTTLIKTLFNKSFKRKLLRR